MCQYTKVQEVNVQTSIRFKPEGVAGRIADSLMWPIMKILSGDLREVPQRTHFWNNKKLTKSESSSVRAVTGRGYFVNVPADLQSCSRGRINFHVPVLGGRKNYVVLTLPCSWEPWHLGWLTPDICGISLIPIVGEVRALQGPDKVTFFAIRPDGFLLPVIQWGCGRIGDGSEYRHVPLL